MAAQLLVLGTSSDAGKSSVAMALCHAFASMDLRVAPFKAQNMSNNAAVAGDGTEIGRAQEYQAEAAGWNSSWHNNPVLLKPESNGRSQLVLRGEVQCSYAPREYYGHMDALRAVVDEALVYLHEQADILVCEGAGSPTELNLWDRDLANMYLLDRWDMPWVLVADIERGGIFASVIGTMHLLAPWRHRCLGVIINKFRGDRRLFDEGIQLLESRTGVPVLGVLPHVPLGIDMEDSLSIAQYPPQPRDGLPVAFIRLPHVGNYNDIDPLIHDPQVRVDFIETDRDLRDYGLLVLPGSKCTIEDLRWLRQQGLDFRLQQARDAAVPLVAICGGYQMLFASLVDSLGHESGGVPTIESGLGWIEGRVVYEPHKCLCRTRAHEARFGTDVEGYEIHSGRAELSCDWQVFLQTDDGRRDGVFCPGIVATHLHGLLRNDDFRHALLDSSFPGRTAFFDYSEYRRRHMSEWAQALLDSMRIDVFDLYGACLRAVD